jgi:hypothetical protein
MRFAERIYGVVALEPGERLDRHPNGKVGIYILFDSDHAAWIGQVAKERGVNRSEVIRDLIRFVAPGNMSRCNLFSADSWPPNPCTLRL